MLLKVSWLAVATNQLRFCNALLLLVIAQACICVCVVYLQVSPDSCQDDGDDDVLWHHFLEVVCNCLVIKSGLELLVS